MWDLLLSFLKNDLTFPIRLAAGVILVAHKLPVRRRLWARVLLLLGVILGWSVLFQLWGKVDPGSILIRSILKYLCAFALATGFTLFCYHASFRQALFASTVAYCLEHIAQRLQAELWKLFPALPTEVQHLAELAFAAALYALLYWLIIRHFLCREGEERTSALLIGLSALVIGTDIVLSTVGIDIAVKSENFSMMSVNNTFSILISVLALVISMSEIRMKNAEREQLIVQQLLYNERSQYQLQNEIRDRINVKCHDLKHQIGMLETKLDAQEMEEIKKALEIYDSSLDTGNTALDIVLSNAALICEREHIQFTVMANGKLLNFIRDSDIYSLFGNILDNAIHSVSRIEEQEQRSVMLSIWRNRGFTFVHAENYYTGELTFSDGLPQTTKEDKTYHGYGMLSIRTLAEKYGGDLKICTDDNIFKLDIMFPMPEKGK